MEKIRWAVCGLGSISHAFMRAAKKVAGCEVTACVSSSKERAEGFKAKYGLAHAFTYEEFAAEGKSVADAVYVCTNMDMHFPNTVLFLRAGIPVLCEKAMSLDADECAVMFEEAKNRDVLLMEAMWTRFQPCTIKLSEVVSSGEFGRVIRMEGNMLRSFKKDHRVLSFERGGGTMLDLMVYNVSYAGFIAGVPTSIKAQGEVKEWVDVACDLRLEYPSGTKALLRTSAVKMGMRFGFEIWLENAKIKVPHFHWGTGFKIYDLNGRLLRKYRFPFPDFTYEIEHFNNLLQTGKKESPLRTAEDSIAVMQILSEANRQLGVDFTPIKKRA